MQYKGYVGRLEVDEEAGILHGRVVGLRDLITFQGQTVAEARRKFHRSVDSYLEFCAARGENPEKPYSGQFVTRVDPALHRRVAQFAESQGTSLNAVVTEALRRHVPPEAPRLRAGRACAPGPTSTPAKPPGTPKRSRSKSRNTASSVKSR